MALEHNSYGSNYDEFNNVISSQDANSKTESNRVGSPPPKSNGTTHVSSSSGSEPEPTESEKRFHRRALITVTTCAVFYVVSFLSLAPLTIQFFSARIARDEYHIEFNDSTNFRCNNISSDEENLIDHVQKEASQILLESNVASGIPACITCLLVGSYSDYLGRKPMLIVSTFGGFIRLLILLCIIKFDWNIRLYYIGAVIDGFCGTYFTYILAATAMIADITPKAENRALNFAVIEGVMLPTAAAAQIGVGYLIRDASYFLPACLLCGSLVLSFLINLFLLPETVQWKRAVTLHPKAHVKKVLGFYMKESGPKRRLYLLGLGGFMVITFTNLGRQGVETLYEMSDPICWDSVQIGFYTAIRIVGTAVVAVIFLGLMKNRLSLEFTGVICAVSGAASFVVFGFSQSSSGLYLAAIVGCLYLGSIPIPRAMLSQLTSPTEQGALFSGLSVVETVSSLVSSTLFTLVYNCTIGSFKGAVFMIIAGCTLIFAVFLIMFRLTRAESSLSDFTLLIEPGTDDKNPPCSNGSAPHPSEDLAIGETSNLIKKA